jgi:phytoene/squalene synthetase
MAGIYMSILDEIERDPAVIFRRRAGPSTGQKLALAGRELVRVAVG